MAANATKNKVEDFEYVAQFFGFTPKSFVDGVYNAINDYIQECFKEMGKVLDEEFAKQDETSKSRIQEAHKELLAKCYRSVDSSMDKMELYMLRNIFTIPSDVLLPEDQVHRDFSNGLNLTEEDIDKEILDLKSRIRKEIVFKQMLRAQQEKLERTLEDLKRLEHWFDDVCSEINTKNLREAINSASVNSHEIKDILQNQKQLKM